MPIGGNKNAIIAFVNFCKKRQNLIIIFEVNMLLFCFVTRNNVSILYQFVIIEFFLDKINNFFYYFHRNINSFRSLTNFRLKKNINIKNNKKYIFITIRNLSNGYSTKFVNKANNGNNGNNVMPRYTIN